jgi:hypothetical protein
MHDTNVLFHAHKNDQDKFPHPPKGMHGWILVFFSKLFSNYFTCNSYIFKFAYLYPGKYYHLDARYPNRPVYLAPYKGQRYHVLEWRKGPAPSGEQELFNHLHSSIRNVVERSFGVWKMKWRILLKMPSYPIEKQKMIVATTMCLHNFIRENSVDDKLFSKCDRNSDYVPTIPSRYSKYVPTRNIGDTSTSESSDRNMDKFRDDLARAIYLSRSS